MTLESFDAHCGHSLAMKPIIKAINQKSVNQGGKMTHEELDAIEKLVKNEEHELQCSGLWEAANALIATARAAIPRPIGEAPRDGTEIDVIWPDGSRTPDCRFHNGEWVDGYGDPMSTYVDVHEDWTAGATYLPIPTPEANNARK